MGGSGMWRFIADDGDAADNQGLEEEGSFFVVTNMNEHSFIIAH